MVTHTCQNHYSMEEGFQWWLQEFFLGGSLKTFNKKNLNISNYRPKKKI